MQEQIAGQRRAQTQRLFGSVQEQPLRLRTGSVIIDPGGTWEQAIPATFTTSLPDPSFGSPNATPLV